MKAHLVLQLMVFMIVTKFEDDGAEFRRLGILPLTVETLQNPQNLLSRTSAPQDLTQTIQRWASNCNSCSEAEMAPPQTLSVTSSGQRRASKPGTGVSGPGAPARNQVHNIDQKTWPTQASF
ncbi:hypothetical protein AJ78_07931 [Emergomyces pasteurianus Ep9510]|uniref:Uncharacterized protein n=1 Tax=Emergomyces pasteurianus Ep9510 TaxID=1447872 RepID=A0A1J9P5V4_9EURO|nr:hypothetical protein AJ78_07931 [Emergomyces pasteurianus Ep9510]